MIREDISIKVVTEYDGSDWISYDDFRKFYIWASKIIGGEISKDSTVTEIFDKSITGFDDQVISIKNA